MFTTLEDWRNHLESLNPSRIELGLGRVRQVFNRLDFNPSGRVIVVAGTNGKGSTVAALEAMLIAKGLSVGSYTSPHLVRFNERIRYMGIPADNQELVDTFNQIESLREDIPLTYFEFMTLAGIAYLKKKAPDYFVFEVGLGGRLDAVNVLNGDVSIVTGVAFDHMDWLGDDLETIGFEKAGVYRANTPAIYASEDCPGSIKKRISDINAVPYLAGDNIRVIKTEEAELYQIHENGNLHEFSLSKSGLPAPSILAALTALKLLGVELSSDCLEALSNTEVAGRYQKLVVGRTDCLLDVAHNAQAVEYLSNRLLKDDDFCSSVVVVGVMSDKLLEAVFIPMLPIATHWIIVRPDIDRAASVEDQYRLLVDLGVEEKNMTSLGAIKDLPAKLNEFDRVVVYGSFYTVGQFLSLFGEMSD